MATLSCTLDGTLLEFLYHLQFKFIFFELKKLEKELKEYNIHDLRMFARSANMGERVRDRTLKPVLYSSEGVYDRAASYPN